MQDLLDTLRHALNTQRGVALKCEEPQRLISKLHEARRNAPDREALDALVIAVSRTDPTSEVWIVRQSSDQVGEPNGA